MALPPIRSGVPDKLDLRGLLAERALAVKRLSPQLRTAGTYVLISAAWIWFSGHLLGNLVDGLERGADVVLNRIEDRVKNAKELPMR